ncbi:MAG: hypothetical protein OXD47_07415 [Gammaproteobacteria bacterium]|nr:hypothetical protein [Gammaproteobacteria bacterium]MCY4211359.1 hypothetical protein [Gammaproteobacteria bacterium]MCY4282423.1 hypothetical protein [Gammaproteobacteria bacterium]MCY4338617.1 hypothetical protein [Gammaproteobacteria bacterium]
MGDISPEVSKSLPPAVLNLVGLTPLLAVCTTLLSGLCMGLALLAALLLSALTVAAVGHILPSRYRVARYSLVYVLLIAATWVSVIELLLQAWSYALREQLGIYLYLLAMNTTLLLQLERAPLQQGLGNRLPACLRPALTGVALLTLTGLVRELVTQGGVLTDIQLLAQAPWLHGLQPVPLFSGGLHLFGAGAGAFMVFGLLLALRSYCTAARDS